MTERLISFIMKAGFFVASCLCACRATTIPRSGMRCQSDQFVKQFSPIGHSQCNSVDTQSLSSSPSGLRCVECPAWLSTSHSQVSRVRP
ncbi:hypothetical protein BDW62DRAFT_140153 [Aspergillus aurantiobrunneus]